LHHLEYRTHGGYLLIAVHHSSREQPTIYKKKKIEKRERGVGGGGFDATRASLFLFYMHE